MNTKRFLVLFLMGLSLLFGGALASPAAAQSDAAWQTYTNSNCVRDLALEGGYIWAATCGGVVRWNRLDGTYLKYTAQEGLPTNNIQAVTIDRAGHKWFGTPFGVSEFDGQSWKIYTTKNGLPTDEIYAIAVDLAGNIWVGGRYKIGKFDGQSWIDYSTQAGLNSEYVIAMTVDKAGSIWAAVTRSELLRFDGQSWTRYTERDGLIEDNVNAVAVDEAGQVWAAAIVGISKFDGQAWTSQPIDWEDKGRWGAGTVAVDKTGQVWFANPAGVGVFDEQAGATRLNEELKTVEAIIVDADNNKWFATAEGLVRFDGQDWTPYLTDDGPAGSDVKALAIDEVRGQVWAGTDQGLSQFDGHKWTTYTTEDGLTGNDVSAIAISRAGEVWIGTEANGVSRFDGRTWQTYRAADSLVEDRIVAIVVDHQDRIWVGTEHNGVSIFNGQRWISYNRDNGLVGSDIKALAVDQQGQVWVSSTTWRGYAYKSGVNRFDGENWTTYTTEDGLAGNYVYDIFADKDGDVWFGTAYGVSRFDGKSWTTYSRPEKGRASYDLKVIAADNAGNIWFDNVKFDGCTFSTYTPTGGLASTGINDIVVDQAGRIWFATTRGISRFDDTLSTVNTGVAPADNIAVRTLLAGPGQPGRLYTLTDEGEASLLLVSDNFGQTWQPFAGGLPVEPACLHDLSMDYATPDALYASTCRGVYRWLDGQWRQISSQEMGMVSIPYGQPQTLWATTPAGPADVPISRSDDGGQTWLPASRFLEHANGVAKIIPDPRQSNLLYATIWPEYADGHLRRGTAEGQWEAMITPLNNTPVEPGFTLDGASGTLYVATNSAKGQLWRSCQPRVQDVKAVQWEALSDFGQSIHTEVLASGWGPNGQALYLNLKDVTIEGNEPVLHRSLDGGHTWFPLPVKF